MKVNDSHGTFISAYALPKAYSDQTKEESCEQLDHAIQSVPRSDKLLLPVDFNAHVGSYHKTWYKVLGHHGIGNENSNGTLLLTLWTEKQLVITNAPFTQKDSFKTPCRHPQSGHWHQINFVIIRQREWHDVKLTHADKASTCHSNHALLKSKVSISFQLKKQHQQVERTKKLDFAKLANSETQDTLRDNIASAPDDLLDRH